MVSFTTPWWGTPSVARCRHTISSLFCCRANASFTPFFQSKQVISHNQFFIVCSSTVISIEFTPSLAFFTLRISSICRTGKISSLSVYRIPPPLPLSFLPFLALPPPPSSLSPPISGCIRTGENWREFDDRLHHSERAKRDRETREYGK